MIVRHDLHEPTPAEPLTMPAHLLPDEICRVGDAIRYAATYFADAGLHFGHGTDNALDEAHALVMQMLSLPFNAPDYIYAANLTAAERARLAEGVARRVDRREPVAYITGEAWFCGLAFDVDARVLIPRSPIAELIETRFDAYAHLPEGARVLDMCTGVAASPLPWPPGTTMSAWMRRTLTKMRLLWRATTCNATIWLIASG